ncbi:sugar phosphate isomerase/epimerase family protein [Anaerotalea alkaliphila]|nr:TIM barrel protein [Anaerotalea alkaliphila]
MKISGAPCCWGVDNPKNPYLPPWERVLKEASEAGYSGMELGPYGYIPMELEKVAGVLAENKLNIIAGTIFDDLVSEENFQNLIGQTHDICGMVTKLPQPPQEEGQRFKTPYLVVIDWGHDGRDYAAGHPDRAPRLNKEAWNRMMDHIRAIAKLAWETYGVRTVVHPHAGGYIEFADEIDQVAKDIPQEVAGLCLDTGHLYYSKMDPIEWLLKYKDRIDYLHFKDIDRKVYDEVMNEKIRFFDACAKGVMCPIGKGVLPYEDIHRTLQEMGYAGYITVEQERDPRNVETSLRDVKASRDYLASVGFD